jgi:hypothetical protein
MKYRTYRLVQDNRVVLGAGLWVQVDSVVGRPGPRPGPDRRRQGGPFLRCRELPDRSAAFHLVPYGTGCAVVLPLAIGTCATEVAVDLDASGKRLRVSISYDLPFAGRTGIPQASATARDEERVNVARAVRPQLYFLDATSYELDVLAAKLEDRTLLSIMAILRQLLAPAEEGPQ